MKSAPTKLKADAIPFPAPPQLSSPSSREGGAAQLPPVEPSTERSNRTEHFPASSALSSTPSQSQQRSEPGKASEQPRQLYATPAVPDQPLYASNSLGIAFPTSNGQAPLQAHATPAPLHSPLRFPASEHPLPPYKGRSMSLGGIMSPLGPSPPLPRPFNSSAPAPSDGRRSYKPKDSLQGGYDSSSPGLQTPGAPAPYQHPQLHPSPSALHHHHSFPALPQYPLGFAFPSPSPSPFSPLAAPLYPPPSPGFYPSPPTPQLCPIGPPSLRHHHSFSCSSSHSSQSIDAPNSLGSFPVPPFHHPNFPASPPLLALSAIEHVERRPSSSPTTTCDVWDCFAPASCEVSPCSCVLCHRHLRIILHGARVVEAAKSGARAAGADDDIAAQGRMKKLFECVGCWTHSQAIEKGVREEQEQDLMSGLDEFELGAFGVRDLSASPTTASTSPPPSSPPPRPRKVTLPSTIVQPAFPLTQAVTSRSRSASSPAALDLVGSPPAPSAPPVRERVSSAPFSLPGGRLLRQEPPFLDLGDSLASASTPSEAPLPAPDRTILRLDNIPWSVNVAHVAEWLPEGCRPPSDTPSPSIYIVLHRETGRTQSRCFVDILTPGAIEYTVENRNEVMLRDRLISVKAVAHEELLQALFHQVPNGVNPAPEPPSDLSPRLPPKEELDLLVEACRRGGAGRRTVSYHPERPFLNIVQLIEKFPWTDTTSWSPAELQDVFECAEEAAKIAMRTIHRDPVFGTLADRLKSIVISSLVFSSEHKERMRRVAPPIAGQNPVRQRKSFPSHSNPPRAPNGFFSPPSPTSYRPRRGSLLGPNASARRSSLAGVPNGSPSFPALPSSSEHRPTALPLSPPETPPGLPYVPLMGSPPQARKSKSVGQLNSKGGWGAKGLQVEAEAKR